MASLGDVTVQFRANTTQFSASMRRIGLDFARAKKDFASGIISAETYANSLRHSRLEAERLGATLGASKLLRQMSAAELAMVNTGNATRVVAVNTEKVAKASVKARQGLGTIRSAGASLTARMVGLNGTLGTLVSGLGQFAIGNAFMIGVLGGIAAGVAGFKRLTKGARDAKEEMERLIALGKGFNLISQRAVLQQQLGQIEGAIAGEMAGRDPSRFRTTVRRLENLLRSQKAVADLNVARAAVQAQLNELQDEEIAKGLKLKGLEEQRLAAIQAMADLRREMSLIGEAPATTAFRTVDEEQVRLQRLLDAGLIKQDQYNRALEDVTKKMHGLPPVFRDTVTSAQNLANKGFRVVQQTSFDFSKALRGSIQALGGFTVMLRQILGNAVGGTLGNVLSFATGLASFIPGVSAIAGAVKMATNIGGGGFTGASANMGPSAGMLSAGAQNATIVLPPADPAKLGRSQAFQVQLREGTLTARSQGFR